MAPIHREQGEVGERCRPLRLVADNFNKQENLHMRLVLGDHKTNRSSHLPAKILKVYIEVLMGFSHIFRPDGLNNTLLSMLHFIKQLPVWQQWTECIFQGQRREGMSECPGPAPVLTSYHVLSIMPSSKMLK